MGEEVRRPGGRRIRGLIAVGVVALPMAVTACGSSGSGSSGSSGGSQTIQVGDLESLTGAGASVGVPQADAMKLAANKINASGGIKSGGKTYKLQLITVDDKSDPTAGVTAVQKLLNSDKVKYMVGSTSSAVTAAYIPAIKNRQDFVSVVVSAALAGITQNPQVYRPRVTNSQYTDATVKYIADHPNLKRIAMLTDKEHAGFVAETPRLKSLLQQKGVQTVADESYTFGDTDFGGQLSKMLRANPDVLNIRGYPADVSRAIKQAREQGYKGLIITNSGTTATEVKDAQAAGAMGNVIDIFAPLPSDQIKLGINTGPSKQFLNSFQSRYHTEPGGTSASAYDGLRILAAALAKSGDPTDVAKVKKALDGLTMSDVPGLVTSFKPQPGDRLFNARQSYFTVVGRTWSSQKDDWQASTAI